MKNGIPIKIDTSDIYYLNFLKENSKRKLRNPLDYE